MYDMHHADGDLAKKLQEQADFLRRLSSESSSENAIPSVFSLRDRSLQRREIRARRTSYLASSALVLTILGWGWQGLKSVDIHSSELELRTVGAGSISQAVTNDAVDERIASDSVSSEDRRIYTKWWEPVALEWVDEDGQSLGFAGYVSEKRESWIDPHDVADQRPSDGALSDGALSDVGKRSEFTIEEFLLEPAF